MKSKILAAAVIAVALAAAACSDDGADTTTTTAPTSTTTTIVQGDFAFGSGAVPPSVPESFPLPDQHVVGSTLENTKTGLVEMVLTFPDDLRSVADFFEASLPEAGYEVTSAESVSPDYLIEFSGENVTGVIRVTAAGGLSGAVVRIEPAG